MEGVFSVIAEAKSTFNLGDEEIWRELYEPLLPEPPTDITVVRDVRYGPAERNRLDVFIPTDRTTIGKTVLMFVHGGGFFSGDKGWTEKCWANIGYWFAQHDIIVVTVNHQLVPNVVYPGGANDMQLAREWIYNNITSENFGCGSPEKVLLFGHSSGGAHIAMNLYAGGHTVFPPVAGVIYMSVPFWYDSTRPVRSKILREYYGSNEESVWAPLSPLGLFEHTLSSDSLLLDSTKIPMYIGTVEWEVEEAKNAALAFHAAYERRMTPGSSCIIHTLPIHNHLSNVLSIGTTDTAQADKLLDFIKMCVRHEGQGKCQTRQSDLSIVAPRAMNVQDLLTR